jgi:hypothetical protein
MRTIAPAHACAGGAAGGRPQAPVAARSPHRARAARLPRPPRASPGDDAYSLDSLWPVTVAGVREAASPTVVLTLSPGVDAPGLPRTAHMLLGG